MDWLKDGEKHTPDGVEGTCQCVRDHDTLIDQDWTQCRAQISDAEHNRLCRDCWEKHGRALSKVKVKE